MAAVATMNGHFIYYDSGSLQESSVNDVINNISNIPPAVKQGFLILVLRYVNPANGTELWGNIKIGHYVCGHDHYYVDFKPAANPEYITYGLWDGNTTGNTRITLYELRGENIETKQLDVRANTLPAARIFDGILVSDQDWNTALAMARGF